MRHHLGEKAEEAYRKISKLGRIGRLICSLAIGGALVVGGMAAAAYVKWLREGSLSGPLVIFEQTQTTGGLAAAEPTSTDEGKIACELGFPILELRGGVKPADVPSWLKIAGPLSGLMAIAVAVAWLWLLRNMCDRFARSEVLSPSIARNLRWLAILSLVLVLPIPIWRFGVENTPLGPKSSEEVELMIGPGFLWLLLSSGLLIFSRVISLAASLKEEQELTV